MKKLATILFIAFVCHAVNTNGQTLSSRQTKTIESEVDSSFQKMLVLAEKLDYDAMIQGVDDRRKAGFLVNAKFYPDYGTLISSVKLGAQGVSKQKLVIKEKKITVLSDDIALLTTYGNSSVSLSDGREFTGDFYWSFVYEKIDDEWKVIQSHQSRGR